MAASYAHNSNDHSVLLGGLLACHAFVYLHQGMPAKEKEASLHCLFRFLRLYNNSLGKTLSHAKSSLRDTCRYEIHVNFNVITKKTIPNNTNNVTGAHFSSHEVFRSVR